MSIHLSHKVTVALSTHPPRTVAVALSVQLSHTVAVTLSANLPHTIAVTFSIPSPLPPPPSHAFALATSPISSLALPTFPLPPSAPSLVSVWASGGYNLSLGHLLFGACVRCRAGLVLAVFPPLLVHHLTKDLLRWGEGERAVCRPAGDRV